MVPLVFDRKEISLVDVTLKLSFSFDKILHKSNKTPPYQKRLLVQVEVVEKRPLCKYSASVEILPCQGGCHHLRNTPEDGKFQRSKLSLQKFY